MGFNEDLLEEARKNRNKAEGFERDNNDEAREDLKFIAGEQWDRRDINQRTEDGRPYLTVNQLPQFVNQITGDVRLNPPAIKVLPAEEGDTQIAQVYTGLIRNIESQSAASKVYVGSAESCIRCGIGNFRIVTEFADDDTFNQEIRIRPIKNPFAVFFDPQAQLADRSDANWCFVLDEMDIDAFKEEYPEALVTDFTAENGREDLKNWVGEETITIAEYWRKEKVKKTLAQLETGEVVDITDLAKADVDKLPVLQMREVDSHKVVQYFISGSEVLDGPFEWPGRHIPIVPVIGQEIHIGERTVRHGITRFAKDSQRQYNYWQTTATEAMALSPKSPYIATEKQVEGHPEWQDANSKNYSVLTYTPDPDVPGAPQRNPPPEVPAAALNMMQVSAQDMRSTIGLHDPNLGAVGNETSGLAISLRQSQGNVGTYVYIDNLASAIEYAGRQLVDLIPKVYDSERVVRVLGEDDEGTLVTINQMAQSNGEPVLLNDLTVGKYDVIVKTGPSFATKRIEAANGMVEFIRALPQAGAATADLVAKAQDWPLAEKFAERLERTIPAPILTGQPAPPDPEKQASVAKDQADAAKKAAEAEGQELENLQAQLVLAAQTGVLQQALAPVVQQLVMQLLMPPQNIPQ